MMESQQPVAGARSAQACAYATTFLSNFNVTLVLAQMRTRACACVRACVRTRAAPRLLSAVQKFLTSRGGDRSIYRVVYTRSAEMPPVIESISRHAEYLSPERTMSRAEFLPIASFNESVNSLLEVAVSRLLKHVEPRLRVRFTRVVLDFILDEHDVVYLLWPRDAMMVDTSGGGGAASTAAVSAAAGDADSNAVEMLPSSLDSTLGASASIVDEYTAMVGHTVGMGLKASILLVESDPTTALSAVHCLVNDGYSVTLMDDGSKALALLRASAFDCILIARDLPALSGLEVARMIRQREANAAREAVAMGKSTAAQAVPIIIFTERTSPADVQVYRDIGLTGCVSKPVHTEALLKTIAAAVPDAPQRPYPTSSAGGAPSVPLSRFTAPLGSRASLEASATPRSAMPHLTPLRAGTSGTASAPVSPDHDAFSSTTAAAFDRTRMSASRSQRLPPQATGVGSTASPYASTAALAGTRRTKSEAVATTGGGGGSALTLGPVQTPRRRQRASEASMHATTQSTPTNRFPDADDDAVAAGTLGGDLSRIARPVTGGPHGGRIGRGAGMPIHGGDARAGAGSKVTSTSDDAILGSFRFDAETELPYCV
ncbi:response regulator, partial [archaeon]